MNKKTAYKCIECGHELPDNEQGYCYECCEGIAKTPKTMKGYTQSCLGVQYCFLNVNGRGYLGRGRSSREALLQALSIAINYGER